MALQKEIWINDIQENLYKNNDFMTRSMDDSGFAISYKTIHVPQAGANASVVADRSSFPGTITQRTDTELTYNMVQYSADPFLITDLESLQVSYDKRKSVMGQFIDTLTEVVANKTLYAWAPSGAATRTVLTTGSDVSNALAPSATGTRKALTLTDILGAKAILDKDAGVPQTGRVMVIPSDIYNFQLLAIADVYQAQSYGMSALPTGVVNRIHGFDVYVRPTVVVYALTSPVTAPTLKATNDSGAPSSPASTDNLGILCYHPNFVSRALGQINVAHATYDQKPEYYGDVMSAYVMHGAAKRRSDGKGVAVIVQGA